MNNCNGDPLCEQVAQVYVEAVVNFGDYAYHNAQSGGSVNILGNEMFAPDVTNIDIDLNSINPNE